MKKFLLLSFMLMFAFTFSESWAQERTVSGKVTSAEDGSTLPGVNVVLKGTTTGTVTDIDGNYSLSVPSGGGVLVFTFVGLATEEVQIGARSVIDLSMTPDVTQLSEVVVQAYGEQSAALNIQSLEQVEGETIKSIPTVTPQEALNGRVAGVQFSGTTGILGGETNVRIRGVSSITSGTRPLYVVDGVPLNDVDISDGLGGASGLDPLLELNANDIKTMTVLKDASATALYGSRGANGVILITTKKGRSDGSTRFNYDFYTGWSEPTIVRDMLSADQFRQFRSDVRTANGTPTQPSDFPQGGFDWIDGVLQTGRINNHSISVSGGDEKTQYFLGATYADQTNHWIGNDLERWNGRFNFTHQASDKVKLGWNISVSRTDGDRSNTENSTFSPYTSGSLILPWVQPTDEDGDFVNTGFIQNVIAIEELNLSRLITRRTIGNVFFEFEPIESLVLRTDFGADIQQAEEVSRTIALLAPPAGTGTKDVQQVNKWLNTTTLNYSRTFGRDHNVSATLGFTYESQVQLQTFAEGNTFISDDLITLNNAAVITGGGSFETGYNLAGYFSRINYDLKSKYLLEASLRRDGSSRFGANNRYGTFWAAKAGWIISNEDFMSDFGAIDFLRLSAGYGITGNDRIGNFASLGLYGAGADYAGFSGIEPSQPANPDLTWETVSQLDISLKADFFKGRLGFDFSVYDKTTTDALLDIPVLVPSGFNSVILNAGEIRNRGIDLLVEGTPVVIGDFSWTSSVNMGFLDNEVIDLPGAAEDVNGDGFIAAGDQRAVEGRSINEFFLTRYVEIDPATGDPVWLTLDGERTNTLSTADRVYAGSAIPTLTGGFTNTFSYKGLSASIFISFVSGNDILVGDLGFVENPASGGFNHSERVLNYWTQPGDNAEIPRLNSPFLSTFDNTSTRQLVSGSHARLRNVTVSYNLPKSILEKTKVVRSLRFYVSGNNLATWFNDEAEAAGVDPEVNQFGDNPQLQGESFFSLPQARSIQVGVNLGF